MSPFSMTALAISMSADAFAVAVAKGAGLQRPRLRDALRSGMIFGMIEAITPLIGWALGLAASRFIQEIDHWVAFVLLAGVGAKLLHEGLSRDDETPEAEKPTRHGLGVLVITAIGTSIDALAVGVTLAFLPVNIWLMAAAIGTATCIMVTLGIMTGHYIGSKIGRYAEVLGGTCLILIGTGILLSHLGYIG